MVDISDEYMQARLTKVRTYSLLQLKIGPNYQPRDVRSAEQSKIVREHGRRNMQLQAEGKMALVGPVHDAGALVGIGIFTVPEAEARVLMDADPAVQAGILVCEYATLYGFPGDGLPA